MHKEKGFTLIETSILIILISLILVPLYGYMTQIRVQEKTIAEETEIETILAAISKFLKENNRYPCPARLDIARGNNNFGKENCSISGPDDSKRGGIPTVELGLSQDYAANMYDWKYLYAVGSDLTDSGTYDFERPLKIDFESGGNTTSAFVVINPGADGKGTSNMNGISGPACVSSAAKDAENCDDDIDYYDGFNAKLNDPNDANYYDDTIAYAVAREESTHWKTKNNTNATGSLDITVRKPGGVSIGTTSAGLPVDPGAYKLMVKGGNVRVNHENSSGGSLDVENTIDSEDNVQSSEGNMDVDVEVRSPIYYYD